MVRKYSGLIILLLLLCLSACKGKEKYEPYSPLSKVTVSPKREADIQAALEGNLPIPTEKPIIVKTEVPVEVPTFDEKSFFAEVIDEPTATEEVPFDIGPTDTPTPVIPTATPLPTATKPYDPNIMMYGSVNGLTTYTLQEGDSLVCLGRRFNISIPQLRAQNGLSSPDEVAAGDTIRLPRSASPWSMIDGYGRRMLVIHPSMYTVRAGDTLFSIACAYGDVLPEDIAVQNKLVLGEPLKSGITITVP